MKFSFFIDKNREEEVIVYTHEENELLKEIESLVIKNSAIWGYTDEERVIIHPSDTECFTVENNKVYAQTSQGKFRIKERLYQLENKLPDSFIKINKSCIANKNKIQKFDVSLSGTLTVVFKSGYRDYVSRRNIRNIKERFGI
ncbi:MAG: LytTR family transcriptional regulator [Clostridia bacterium]|nr:LytTR family transcriptional regulator [Clostridia bacterium]